jgi:hypothetical protein
LPYTTPLLGQKEHGLHGLHHLAVVGGRAEEISIIALKIFGFLDFGDILDADLNAGHAQALVDEFCDTFGVASTAGIDDKGLSPGVIPP